MYRLIAFDIYSATLDIYGSAIPAVEKVLGVPRETAEQFFDLWRTKQWYYLLLKNSMRDGYKSYYDITRDLLGYVEKVRGMALTEDQREQLMDIWTSFRAWPESKEILEIIRRKGYPIAMLSNGDGCMLRPLEKSSGISFDYIFSGDMAKSYKPAKEIYQLPFDKLGIGKEELLHVAGSMFDVMGAKAAGIHVAWINRRKEVLLDGSYKPDYEFQDLSGLLRIL